MNRELEAILLTENESRLERINDFLEEDYKQTIVEMFVILLNSIKTQTISDINRILSNIETIVLNQDSKNFKIINKVVLETNSKMQEIKKGTDCQEFKKIKFRLVDLNRKMIAKKEKNTNHSLYNFYHYLIFEEKNLDMIELVLKNDSNILAKKDEFDNNLLYNIIEHFCSLHENEDKEDIAYFYDVIVLILKSEESKLIKQEREEYLELLNRKFCKNKTHVKEIEERFQDFYMIDIKDLERKYNVSSKFHDSIFEEIKGFTFDFSGRKRFNCNFITIDDKDAECLDDAISLKRNKDGSFYYYIAITDVPSFIPYGTLTFYTGMKQVETLYLTDKRIGMFPDIIANNYCSLLPNVQRNVIVYRVLVDPKHQIDYDSLKIIPGVITVQNRLSYGQVNKQENIDSKTAQMIEDLALISYNLKKQNKVKEKYRKIENMINSRATYHHSMFVENSISANIIQESMLLVNHLAAKYFEENGLVYIYRNLKIKSDEFINAEAERLIESSHVNTEEVKTKMILNLLYDSYLGAYYSTENLGHQGLGYDSYSHSTSAARRFGDSFNQYLTHEQVFKAPVSDARIYELEQLTKEVVNHINAKKKENTKFESEYNYLNGKKLIRKR